MRVRAPVLALLAALAVPAAALSAEPSRAERASLLRAALDYGRWNNRINALYDAGDEGADGLPLLVYACDDADWQVRLTAVHFMGKLGPAAAPALGRLARAEECPRVRISALRWLQEMGPAAESVLQPLLTPEDERLMADLPDRYGTEHMGKPLAIEVPDGLMPELFHGALDPRVCASSEYSRRTHRHGREAAKAPPEDEAPADFEVRTPPVPAKKAAPAADVAAAAAVSTAPSAPAAAPRASPESLSGPALLLPRRPLVASALGRYETADARSLGGAELPARRPKLPPPESFPPGAPGLYREPEAAAAKPLYEPDAGTGKPENDPVPALIAQLSAPDARTRTRAADELGKRGDAARPALPALRKALKDRDPRVRASAVLALGNVGSTLLDVVGDIKRALRDKNEDVRFSAQIALQRISPAR